MGNKEGSRRETRFNFKLNFFVKVCGVNGGGQCPRDIKETPDTCGVCGGDESSCHTKGIMKKGTKRRVGEQKKRRTQKKE